MALKRNSWIWLGVSRTVGGGWSSSGKTVSGSDSTPDRRTRRFQTASYPVGGDRVTNLAWYEKSLYVTVAGKAGAIYRLDVNVRGAP